MTQTPRCRPLFLALPVLGLAVAVRAGGVNYKLLATSKTSTMEKELNEAADAGYRLAGVMGGETSFGGDEVVAVVQKEEGGESGKYRYKLLATSKTSTMQKEMQEAADAGYEYAGQTVFSSAFGGDEVVVIMEKAPTDNRRHDYFLLATKKTSTLEKELREAGEHDYHLMGVTVSKTKFGGKELIAILRREAKAK